MTTHIDISSNNNAIVSLCEKHVKKGDDFQYALPTDLPYITMPDIDCPYCLAIVSCLKSGLTFDAAFKIAADLTAATIPDGIAPEGEIGKAILGKDSNPTTPKGGKR